MFTKLFVQWYLKGDWEREEIQTHRRKECSWEFNLKHSFKLLCNAPLTDESMQKVGGVGAPAWEAVSPTHEGFTVVHKCDVAKTWRNRFLFAPLVYEVDEQLEHWLQLCNAEPESVNPAFYKIAFIFEVACLDTKVPQTAPSNAYLMRCNRECAQPLDKMKQVNQQPKIICHIWRVNSFPC